MSYRVLAVYAILCLLGLFGCDEERDVATVPSDVAALDADFVVVGGEQYITQEGETEAHMVYDTAFQWLDSTAVALRRLELVVFNEDGSERARVTADRGRLDRATNRMVAWGDVVLAIPGEGRTLRTQELHYDPEGERIWSDSSFVMERPSGVLRGDWFSSDLEFSEFEAGRRP